MVVCVSQAICEFFERRRHLRDGHWYFCRILSDIILQYLGVCPLALPGRHVISETDHVHYWQDHPRLYRVFCVGDVSYVVQAR